MRFRTILYRVIRPAIVLAVALTALAPDARARHVLEVLETHDDVAVPGLAGLAGLRLSPDDEHLYARGAGTIVVFDRDSVSGTLSVVETIEDGVGGVEGIADPTDFAVSSDGTTLYVVSGEGAVSAFERDAATGALTQIQVLRDGVGGVDGVANPTSVLVSPDGAHVYVGRDGAEVPLRGPAVFARAPATGLLTFLEVTPESAGIPSEYMVIAPSGADLFSRSGDVILTQSTRDATTGSLTHVKTFPETVSFYDTSTMAMSPDGLNVLVAGLKPIKAPCNCAVSNALMRFDYGAQGVVTSTGVDGVVARLSTASANGQPRDFVVTSSGRWVFTNRGINVRHALRGTIRAFTKLSLTDPRRPKYTPQVPADERFAYSIDFIGGPLLAHEWTCGTLGLSTKIVVKKVGTDTDPTNDILIVKATGYLPRVSVPDLTLDVDGLRFVFWDDDWNELPIDLPGGTYAGGSTAGWLKRKEGLLWQYVDKTATPVNGVIKLQLRDQSSKLPDMVQVKLIAKNGSYPIHIGHAGTVGVVDPGVDFELGDPSRCMATGIVDCRPNKARSAQKCK